MTGAGRLAVVPGALALQPRYASLVDPVADLRRAVASLQSWGVEQARVFTLNGSARRTQASPGPYDERAVPFDDELFAALASADAAALRALDQTLAKEVWASVEAAADLADALEGGSWTVHVDYADAPYGVAWWVIRYEDAGR